MADAVAYLTETGGHCFSRWGSNSKECAPYAFVLSLIHAEHGNGEPIDAGSLDFSMGLVVNDHDDVEQTIRDYGAELGWHQSNGWSLDPDGDLIPEIYDEWMGKAFYAYLDALMWSESDPDNPVPLEDLFDIDDIPVQDRLILREEFENFCFDNWEDLFDMDPEQAGHDFALTRNDHGTGFWDRGLGAQGDRLSKACQPYGSIELADSLVKDAR